MFRPEDTRRTYDRVARRYAEEIAGELEDKPFDREFLDRFAKSMQGRDRVVELGCGPAHIAAYLADRGVSASGLDLSPGMAAEAKRLFPNLDVQVADMLDLPFADGSIDGLIAFYSIIHFDDGQLSRAFSEMTRVLQREGLVAFAFHAGDEVIHHDEWWGESVRLDARMLPSDHVVQLMSAAGLQVVWLEERDPYATHVEYQSRRSYLVARPLTPLPGERAALPAMGLGYARTPLRTRLVDAVLRGDKVATAGLAADYAPNTHEPLPKAGDRWALLGLEDEPVAVVETTDVQLVPAGEVDLEFARDEGEGFESVADWRAAHGHFWSDYGITDDSLIVCERLRLVQRI